MVHLFYLCITSCSTTYHLLTARPHGSRTIVCTILVSISSTSAHEMINFQYFLDLCGRNVALHDMVLIEWGCHHKKHTIIPTPRDQPAAFKCPLCPPSFGPHCLAFSLSSSDLLIQVAHFLSDRIQLLCTVGGWHEHHCRFRCCLAPDTICQPIQFVCLKVQQWLCRLNPNQCHHT